MKTNVNDVELRSKILIAYYTRTGNTEKLANQIKKLVGGDLFKIETVDEYPPSYQEVLKVSKVEIENQYKPPLKKSVENIDKYDIVFVGTPNWYGTMAPPVLTFLSLHDLANKTIIPFATHGGGGEQRCLTDIERICSEATVCKGLTFYSSQAETKKDRIHKWLSELQLI
ncbi:MAG: NAD(P)H-dependent oxidoreductase [Candidatus Heimdallarchaeota archaeon]|nr:NAD(P)H-dependent oxidoreductase [Candidatus Heimdallarchaeota archaeon]